MQNIEVNGQYLTMKRAAEGFLGYPIGKCNEP